MRGGPHPRRAPDQALALGGAREAIRLRCCPAETMKRVTEVALITEATTVAVTAGSYGQYAVWRRILTELIPSVLAAAKQHAASPP